MVFKSQKQLESFLLNKCKVAVADTENKVYAIIKSTLAEFYGEFSPEEYIRTNQLLHSLVKTDVKRVGNGYEAEVYFDDSMLNYDQGGIPLQHTPEHGMSGWATWTGETVLNVAMESSVPHGGHIGGTPVWTVSKRTLGDIKERLKQNLIAQGVPIK